MKKLKDALVLVLALSAVLLGIYVVGAYEDIVRADVGNRYLLEPQRLVVSVYPQPHRRSLSTPAFLLDSRPFSPDAALG